MSLKEGKYTIESFARNQGIQKQSAINLISKLKKKGFVKTSGGGRQKRIYTITKKPQKKTNGFYDVVNKFSPEKLNPKFEHKVIGTYTIEHAIIDGIKIGDVRTLEATTYLFKHIKNWKRLFDIAKEKNCTEKIHELYNRARKTTKCRTMPKKYKK
jgi:predicted DNA-binding WGR domain protein